MLEKERCEINGLSSHLQKLEKEEHNKAIVKQKEANKMDKSRVNERENRTTIQKESQS